MHTDIEKKAAEATDSLPLQDKHSRRLRKQAEAHGIPRFVLRLAAAQRLPLGETETTLRYRRD